MIQARVFTIPAIATRLEDAMTKVLFAILVGLMTSASSVHTGSKATVPLTAPLLVQDDQDQDQDIPRSDEEGEESDDSGDEMA